MPTRLKELTLGILENDTYLMCSAGKEEDLPTVFAKANKKYAGIRTKGY